MVKLPIQLFFLAGKKRKDQNDANLAGMGINPAYSGAYGTTPAVSFSAVVVSFSQRSCYRHLNILILCLI